MKIQGQENPEQIKKSTSYTLQNEKKRKGWERQEIKLAWKWLGISVVKVAEDVGGVYVCKSNVISLVYIAIQYSIQRKERVKV